MKNNRILLAILGCAIVSGISACNNGGNKGGGGNGGGSYPLLQCGGGNGGGDEWEPNPYSCPNQGSYNGTPYNQIPQPNTQANGILKNSYPNSYLPTFLTPKTAVSKNLQIAYGRDDEVNVAKIAAFVRMGEFLCSATPVKYESETNTTFLISAAHCFAKNKTNPASMNESNIEDKSKLTVYYGVNGLQGASYPVNAVFLTKNYCAGATFPSKSSCPNFSPIDGVSGGQGNDIAVIQISGEFGGEGNHVNYPHVVPATEYPATNSLAPILSIGYGVSRQTPGNDSSGLATMYYVAGYQYAKQDTVAAESGYHYLFNSYYSKANPFNGIGYTALICGGDSGGGDLFWTGSKWILLSEHTYGPSNACGQFYSFLPNGATNVSAYYNWIMSIFNSSNPVASCNNGTIPNCVTNG